MKHGENVPKIATWEIPFSPALHMRRRSAKSEASKMEAKIGVSEKAKRGGERRRWLNSPFRECEARSPARSISSTVIAYLSGLQEVHRTRWQNSPSTSKCSSFYAHQMFLDARQFQHISPLIELKKGCAACSNLSLLSARPGPCAFDRLTGRP